MKSPMQLWLQAEQEHPIDGDGRRRRYIELMRAEGHIVKAKPGEDRNLPCGWPGLPSKIDDLVTPEEKEKLDADLAEMARKRRLAQGDFG